MENIKNMFLGVVVCLLFFTVQSSQERNESFSGGIVTSSERTNKSEEIKYPPGDVTITPSNDTFYTKLHGKPLHDITCKADCLPECTYTWYREGDKEGDIYTTGSSLFATKSYHNSDYNRFRCVASNDINSHISNNYSKWITVEVKDGPDSLTIIPSLSARENSPFNLTCFANCYHGCRSYGWHSYRKQGWLKQRTSVLTFHNLSREDSGTYSCEVTDYFGKMSVDYTLKVLYKTVILESRNNELTLRINETLPSGVLCKIDCNFVDCNSNIEVKRDSQHVRNIQSGDSIFESRRAYLSDDGTYVCIADNIKSENNFKLTILHGPRTATILRNHQTISGDVTETEDISMTICLRCSSTCNPQCKIVWYKDGQLYLEYNPVINIWRERRMSGVYQCEASGVEGKVKSAQVQVIIQYPPGNVTITPDNDTFYTKRDGKPLHDITCEADCVPECTYMWHREIHNTQYRYTTGNSLFATNSYDYSGSSRFRCRASYYIRPYSMYSRWITVEVKGGPDNVTIIPSLSNKEKSTFTLSCSANCYDECQSYSWIYNGSWRNERTQNLTFPSLSKEDSGKYRCTVTDYFGTIYSNYYSLNVSYGPGTVIIHVYNSNIYNKFIEGQDYITLTCNADCNPECSYLFYRNGKLLNIRYTREPVYRNMSGQYTCSAKNSVLNTYRNSSNSLDINIKYKPTITSFVNRKSITAPDVLNLNFSVDSFPSSRVAIFHETKRLTFIPNVTGQLSFNVSIESCLDQGEYRVEAMNDAGSKNLSFIAYVECLPVIVNYSPLPQRGFQVGDLLNYKVDFVANPDAKVTWTFVGWKKEEFKKMREPQIQIERDCTKVIINKLNFSNFGKYELELKNDLGKITKEFYIRGPPQSPTDLTVDCPGSAIISWRPGFDGGTTQNFLIEYSSNSSYWQNHWLQLIAPEDINFMSARINDIQPNTPYSFRIRANNSFGVAESDTTVNCTRQNIDEMASFIDNPNALVGIGVLVLLLLIATAVLIAVLKLKRKHGSNNQDNSLRKQGNEPHEEDNASEIVENILYISADDAKEQIQAPEAKTQNPQNGNDVYAVVEKKPKPDDGEDQPVYTDVCKADQKKKKPAIAAKPSKVKKDERPTVNKDGLIYADLDLKDTPSTSTGAFVIHGADDRTQYVDIDFTRRADPPPDTDNEQSQNEKEKKMHDARWPV